MKTFLKVQSRILLSLPVLLFCTLSCKDNITNNSDIVYEYTVPIKTDDGWEVAPLSETGMDLKPISDFMNEFLNNVEHKIHGILIVKDGKLVFEEYFPGYAFYQGSFIDFSKETTHNLASVTKSFTSALVGIAIEQGFIQDVNQKVFSFFPEYNDLIHEKKDRITLEHLLTMTSGLEWDESTYPYTDSRNDVAILHSHADPIKFILSRPVVIEPGTDFLYSSGSTIVLGEVIKRATGLRADEFANKYLFVPLDINDYKWEELQNDVLFTSGDLKLRPRDMAKLGDLYMHRGRWKDQQIIPEWWIEKSTQSYISASPNWADWDYGYGWWLYTIEFETHQTESYFAQGWGGQNIALFPSLDLVVITTAGYYDDPDLEFHIGVLILPKILASVL